MLLEQKSVLARLMATENLYVEERAVQTASFDLKNRVLTVPILDGNLSANIYDLFMGHEVGHALETPPDGYHSAQKKLGVNGTILNVCEDVRIEKKIKRRYPGIRYPFLKAYEELMERDFFGIKNTDLNKLNLIDRINLYTKCGASLGIEFNEKEKRLLDELEATESFKEMVVVAKKIQKYMKETKQKEIQIQFDLAIKTKEVSPSSEPPEQTVSESSDVSKAESNDDSGGSSEGTQESQEQENENAASEGSTDGSKNTSVKKQDEKKETAQAEKQEEEDIESVTDKNFRKNESKLYEKDKKTENVYCNVPEVNSDEHIISYQTITRLYDTHNIRVGAKKIEEVIQYAISYFNKFKRESEPVVSYLVKEFELRKNAEQQVKARVSKTGDINTNRIAEYSFSDDIFKRLMTVPNGKSHGLVLFVDWSGSMDPYINQTIRQVLNIVFFCRKVNIPYEVYAFTDHYPKERNRKNYIPKSGDINFTNASNIHLLNIFSSKMKNQEFTKLGAYLLQYCNKDHERMKDSNYRETYTPHGMNLGGTPLNEALILAFDILPKFKKQNKVDVVNTIVLSDGDGHYINHICGVNYITLKYTAVNKFMIRDTKTKHSVDMNRLLVNSSGSYAAKQRDALVELLKIRTNSNVICFHITSTAAVKHKLTEFVIKPMDRNTYSGNNPEVEQMHAKFRKDKYFIGKNKIGFSEYYLIKTSDLEIDDGSFEAVKVTGKSLTAAFSKYTNNKLHSRVMLNSFIRMIA